MLKEKENQREERKSIEEEKQSLKMEKSNKIFNQHMNAIKKIGAETEEKLENSRRIFNENINENPHIIKKRTRNTRKNKKKRIFK